MEQGICDRRLVA